MGLAVLLAAGTAQAQDTPGSFKAETVGSMQVLCTPDQSTTGGKQAIGFCYGWIEGVGQFYAQLMLDDRFDLEPSICPEGELTREEIRNTFVDWATANPGEADAAALSGLINALKQAHPCPP